jgi:hypothetical protein
MLQKCNVVARIKDVVLNPIPTSRDDKKDTLGMHPKNHTYIINGCSPKSQRR